tara:strand:+ start:104 stop:379 length:276 start_codon:yes stop_codon:yes gene_type:complete
MEDLVKAAKEMNKILHKCENDGDNFDTTLSAVSRVKVHGVIFPTLMLMEIIDKFAEGYDKRHQGLFDTSEEEKDIQDKYSEASSKWNEKIH